MTSIEKHPKNPMEHIEHAVFSAVPTSARASRAVILRLEDLPATPSNLERIRDQVRSLNRRLADSGTPFRLRVL